MPNHIGFVGSLKKWSTSLDEINSHTIKIIVLFTLKSKDYWVVQDHE